MVAGVLCITFLVLPPLISGACFDKVNDDDDADVKEAATFNNLNERLARSFRKNQKVDWKYSCSKILVATSKLKEYLTLREHFKPTLGYVYVIDRQKNYEHLRVLPDRFMKKYRGRILAELYLRTKHKPRKIRFGCAMHKDKVEAERIVLCVFQTPDPVRHYEWEADWKGNASYLG